MTCPRPLWGRHVGYDKGVLSDREKNSKLRVATKIENKKERGMKRVGIENSGGKFNMVCNNKEKKKIKTWKANEILKQKIKTSQSNPVT